MFLTRSLAAGLLLCSAFVAASDLTPPPLTVTQARREFKRALATMYRGEFNHSWRRVEKVNTLPLRDIQVTIDGFAFEAGREVNNKWSFGKTAKPERLQFRFRDLTPVAISDDHPHEPKAAFFAGPEIKDVCTRKCGVFYWLDRKEAERFARALNRLIEHAKSGKGDVDFVAFQARAEAWRKLASRPPLSPEADRHRILAESAVRENNLDRAAMHYDEALEAGPMWPEGWMNAALIYAELKDYEAAAERMRHYLALLPDAPDAKAAREQMILWEEKSR